VGDSELLEHCDEQQVEAFVEEQVAEEGFYQVLGWEKGPVGGFLEASVVGMDWIDQFYLIEIVDIQS